VNDIPLRNYYATALPTISWTYLTWATAYEIQVDDSPTFATPVFSSTVTGTSTPVGPLPEGHYYVRVRGKQGNVVGGWSAVDSFVIDLP
ncbi:MAG: hypothetical protein JNJ61_19955, partial [Anaerolineae bacterium]|nr:hypothetical protein [Anaerolineae bacterium]